MKQYSCLFNSFNLFTIIWIFILIIAEPSISEPALVPTMTTDIIDTGTVTALFNYIKSIHLCPTFSQVTTDALNVLICGLGFYVW